MTTKAMNPVSIRSLHELLVGVPVLKIQNNASNVRVGGIQHDSRLVEPGQVFIAMSGAQTDGHQFIPQALSAGCAAIVAEKNVSFPLTLPLVQVPNARRALAQIAQNWFDHPSRKLTLLGVTGTNGKTTTTYLIRHLLQRQNLPCGLLGTIFYEYGERKLSSFNTTPDALLLNQLLADMVQEKIRHVVMEVSSHALDQDRVYGCTFHAGVLTNLSRDHLDYHKTMDNYREAKGKLFSLLSPKTSTAILNRDDPQWEYFYQQAKKPTSLLTFGLHPAQNSSNAHLQATLVKKTLTNTQIQLTYQGKTMELTIPLVGTFNVYNLLAGTATLLSLGSPLENLKESLESFKPPVGRLERVLLKHKNIHVFIDYAHTPDALAKALQTLRELKKRSLIVLFGCGGDRDRGKRPEMGQVAETLADHVIVTSDNPRSEYPDAIIQDILEGIQDKKKVRVEPDRAKAIHLALDIAQEGDILLIAGKGHETTQTFKDKIIPFYDKFTVLEAMQSL